MKHLYLLLFMFCSLPARPQAEEPALNYPQGYFRNPLNIPIALAGGFAECRPNHFHTGIDLKTNQKENQPVFAAADGYVSRISISNTGYGNCLYLSHPNGYITVYGHLNDFFPALQQYTVSRQYALESWRLDESLAPDQFPVKKGQQIAWSGNTGGSTGPHLHFEVRSAASGQVLNALLFGLPVKDTRAPEAKSLAVYNGGQSIYEQDPRLFPLSKNGNNYTLPSAVLQVEHPTLMLGIVAQDYTDNSHNWLGIYEMKLFMDGDLKVATRLNAIDFAQNRMVNAYADYKTKEQKGQWYQGLYRLPNNALNAYTTVTDKGKLDLSDGTVHDIKLTLADPMGNRSMLTFKVQYSPKGNPDTPINTCAAAAQYWDCRKPNEISTPTLFFSTRATSLYDDICFTYSETPSEQYLSAVVQLHQSAVPLQDYCPLRIRLNQPLPFDLRSKLVFVHRIKAASLPGNNPQDAVAAKYVQGWAEAEVRTFGNYYVQLDTIAPTITNMQKSNDFSALKQISFRVAEDKTSIKEFRGELNGNWLRFVRSGNLFTYFFDEKCPPGKHELVLTATDENENTRQLRLIFNR